MGLDPVFLSRLQFGFVISFHIIIPAFTIGLAAWLATIEGARLVTGTLARRRGGTAPVKPCAVLPTRVFQQCELH